MSIPVLSGAFAIGCFALAGCGDKAAGTTSTARATATATATTCAKSLASAPPTATSAPPRAPNADFTDVTGSFDAARILTVKFKGSPNASEYINGRVGVLASCVVDGETIEDKTLAFPSGLGELNTRSDGRVKLYDTVHLRQTPSRCTIAFFADFDVPRMYPGGGDKTICFAPPSTVSDGPCK